MVLSSLVHIGRFSCPQIIWLPCRSKFYRQTVLFSSFITPEINFVFNKECLNILLQFYYIRVLTWYQQLTIFRFLKNIWQNTVYEAFFFYITLTFFAYIILVKRKFYPPLWPVPFAKWLSKSLRWAISSRLDACYVVRNRKRSKDNEPTYHSADCFSFLTCT